MTTPNPYKLNAYEALRHRDELFMQDGSDELTPGLVVELDRLGAVITAELGEDVGSNLMHDQWLWHALRIARQSPGHIP